MPVKAPEPTDNGGPAASRFRSVRRGRLFVAVAALAFLAVSIATMGWAFRPRTLPAPNGRLIYSDDFEGSALRDDWRQSEADPGWTAGRWQVVGGRLRGEKIHNAALWLRVPLPEKVRIEFDARAETPDGDVKAEVFGDGRTHQSGYIAIHGGWRNTVRAIARRDEHAEERKEDNRCDVVGRRTRCVEPDVDYHWALVRTGDTLEWYLNGTLLLTYPDTHPVRGRHFAFNGWEAVTSFDNLRIYDLSD